MQQYYLAHFNMASGYHNSNHHICFTHKSASFFSTSLKHPFQPNQLYLQDKSWSCASTVAGVIGTGNSSKRSFVTYHSILRVTFDQMLIFNAHAVIVEALPILDDVDFDIDLPFKDIKHAADIPATFFCAPYELWLFTILKPIFKLEKLSFFSFLHPFFPDNKIWWWGLVELAH